MRHGAELVFLPPGTLEVSIVPVCKGVAVKSPFSFGTFTYLRIVNILKIQKGGVRNKGEIDRACSTGIWLGLPNAVHFLKSKEKCEL